jgi:hypothetical protein
MAVAKKTAAKKAAAPQKKEASTTKAVATKSARLQLPLKRIAIHAQTTLFTLGVALPLGLIWLGTYIMFTFPVLMGQIESYLQNFTAEQVPAIYNSVLIPLNANSSLGYYVVGIALYVIALFLSRFVAARLNLANLTLGNVRVRSILMAGLISFIVAAVVVSLANRVLFDSLLALQNVG